MYDQAAYMRAAILAQIPVDPTAWDELTLRAVFHILSAPPITFEEWLARMLATPPQEDAVNANERFIAFARELSDLLNIN